MTSTSIETLLDATRLAALETTEGGRVVAKVSGLDQKGTSYRGTLVEIDGELRGLDPVHPFVEFGNCDPTVAGGLAQNFDGIVTLLVTDAEGLRGVLVVGTGAGMAHDHYRARSADGRQRHRVSCQPLALG